LKGILLAITYGGAISSYFKLEGSKKKQRKQKQKNASIMGKFKDQHGEWRVAPDIKAYKGEVKEMLDVVEKKYPLVFAAVEKKENNKHENCTRALSYILQELETAVSSMAVLYLIEHGLIEQVDGAYVMSFLHDGFYVNDSKQINDELLVNLAEHINRHAGLEVKFGFKRVDPEFTEDELLALKELPELLLEQKIEKIWSLAQLAFPFPQGTSPATTLSDDSVLKTSNGFDIAVTQHGVGCAQVRIRSGGKLFHSKYLYEVDTIEDDRESRKQGCLATAAEVFGEDAVDNGLVNIQIKHNAGEYIELDPDSLLNSGERYTVFLKGSMGGGKSFLVNNKVAGPILKQGGSALFVAPNISLVDSMVAECARSGVPMTSYQKRKKKRNRVEPQDSSEPPRKKTKLDQWLTPSDDSQLSGDYEFKASTATAKFDEDALITTFDSLGQAENCKPDLIFIDETSKVLL